MAKILGIDLLQPAGLIGVLIVVIGVGVILLWKKEQLSSIIQKYTRKVKINSNKDPKDEILLQIKSETSQIGPRIPRNQF